MGDFDTLGARRRARRKLKERHIFRTGRTGLEERPSAVQGPLFRQQQDALLLWLRDFAPAHRNWLINVGSAGSGAIQQAVPGADRIPQARGRNGDRDVATIEKTEEGLRKRAGIARGHQYATAARQVRQAAAYAQGGGMQPGEREKFFPIVF